MKYRLLIVINIIIVNKMGQKTSFPEKLEYVERIAYANERKLILHDVTNNRVEKIHTIDEHIRGIHNQRKHYRDWSRIASIGIGEVVVMHIRTSQGREFSYRRFLLYLNKEWNEVRTQEFEFDNTDWYGSIDKSLCEKIYELQSGKLKWLTKEQMTEIPTERCESVKFNNVNDMVKITLGGKTSVLNPNYKPSSKIIAICYCRFTKNIIMCTRSSPYYVFVRWRKIGESWFANGKKYHVMFDVQAPPFVGDIVSIIKIECSKNYLFVEARDTNGDVIIVMHKELLYELFRIRGCLPAYRDDYDVWFRTNTELLKTVDVLGKMSEDVLKIILSFVG